MEFKPDKNNELGNTSVPHFQHEQGTASEKLTSSLHASF
jgi:hypothetical protein